MAAPTLAPTQTTAKRPSTWKWRQRPRPGAAIENISCPSGTFTFGGQIALLNLMNAAGPYPGVVSVSYGEPESVGGAGINAVFYATYQQAAAEGISVFVASGDNGAVGFHRIFRVL